MHIVISADEAIERGVWEEVCKMKGWNPWIVNEGLMPPDEQITMTEQEARDVGLIRRNEYLPERF